MKLSRYCLALNKRLSKSGAIPYLLLCAAAVIALTVIKNSNIWIWFSVPGHGSIGFATNPYFEDSAFTNVSSIVAVPYSHAVFFPFATVLFTARFLRSGCNDRCGRVTVSRGEPSIVTCIGNWLVYSEYLLLGFALFTAVCIAAVSNMLHTQISFQTGVLLFKKLALLLLLNASIVAFVSAVLTIFGSGALVQGALIVLFYAGIFFAAVAPNLNLPSFLGYLMWGCGTVSPQEYSLPFFLFSLITIAVSISVPVLAEHYFRSRF